MDMTTTSHQTFTARRPEDVLAAVPIVLGFVPEESVVMLTFGAAHPFHARLDLPLTAAERRAAAAALVEPVCRHGVRRVLFVLYTADKEAAGPCARTLARAFDRRGIDVVDVLRSDGARWFVVPLDRSAREDPGTPYDVTGHLFTAQAVAAGRVTRGSRGELAATLAADAAGAAAVARAIATAADRPAADAAEVLAVVTGLVADGRSPDPATAARILLALREPRARDAVLGAVDRHTAEAWLAAWSALVRVAPTPVLAPVSSVLAFVAWLAGDGALAWCALDRASQGDPPCALAGLVGRALEEAVPPATWSHR